MGATRATGSPGSQIILLVGVLGGVLAAALTVTAAGGRAWTGAAFGWAVLLSPFAVAAAAARLWHVSMGAALARCAVGFVSALLALLVLLAVMYALFG